MDKLQERVSRLEKEIADKLDDEQWENYQELLKYIVELQKEIDYWKEQAEGYSGLAKQIQQDYKEMEQEGIIRYE